MDQKDHSVAPVVTGEALGKALAAHGAVRTTFAAMKRALAAAAPLIVAANQPQASAKPGLELEQAVDEMLNRTILSDQVASVIAPRVASFVAAQVAAARAATFREAADRLADTDPVETALSGVTFPIMLLRDWAMEADRG